MTCLFSTAEEEVVRIFAITDGATDEWKPVEHNWRTARILEVLLSQDVPQHRSHHQSKACRQNLRP